VLVTADPDPILAGVGPVYGRVAERWNAYLDTLSDEQIEFAAELLTRAAEVNREEIERLRADTRG
jgi:hypothetical protein